jgi:hypothetical protein
MSRHATLAGSRIPFLLSLQKAFKDCLEVTPKSYLATGNRQTSLLHDALCDAGTNTRALAALPIFALSPCMRPAIAKHQTGMGDVVYFINFILRFRISATAGVVIPSWRAVSARDIPNSSTILTAITARASETGLRRLPARSTLAWT